MSNVRTYNNFITILKDIATRHFQISSFGYGPSWEVEASENYDYPLLWCNVNSARMDKSANGNYSNFNINFQLTIVDQSGMGDIHDQEIHSDTIEVIKDVVTEISTHPFYKRSKLQIVNDLNIEPLREWSDNNLVGWTVEIELRAINTNTFCGIPTSDIPDYEFMRPVGDVNISRTRFITSIINDDGNLEITDNGETVIINAPIIDDILNDINLINSTFSNYLPVSGGTLTGQVEFQSNLYFNSINDNNFTLDLSGGNIFILSATSSHNLDYINPQIGTYIFIIQNQTTGSTLTFEPNKFATIDGVIPTLTATLGARDLFSATYDGNEMIIFEGKNIITI